MNFELDKGIEDLWWLIKWHSPFPPFLCCSSSAHVVSPVHTPRDPTPQMTSLVASGEVGDSLQTSEQCEQSADRSLSLHVVCSVNYFVLDDSTKTVADELFQVRKRSQQLSN